MTHPRFEGARVAQAELGEERFEVMVAEGLRLRLLGLMRLGEADLRPLLFPSCRSLHTFWMKAPIDVVWLDLGSDSAAVLAVVAELAPRRTRRGPAGLPREARRRVAALELPAGRAAGLGIEAGAAIRGLDF